MILPTVPTLDALSRRSFAHAVRTARKRHSRAPSPRRGIYLALPPTTLLGFRQGVSTGAPRSVTLESKARKQRIESAYTTMGSLEVVESVLRVESRYLAGRRAASSVDEALARRAWSERVVESDLALVEDAVAAGWLTFAPPAVVVESLAPLQLVTDRPTAPRPGDEEEPHRARLHAGALHFVTSFPAT